MAKIISDVIIIGNAIIEAKNDSISIDELREFDRQLFEGLGAEYYGKPLDIKGFCDNYSYFVSYEENSILINQEDNIKEKMIEYFRLGLPINIIDAINQTSLNIFKNDKSKSTNGKKLELQKTKKRMI